uniref:Two-component response regulator n=1 Tax=mine drainage metagenome TaxID=410659 RepID=E6PZM6_9ZZZZ
MDNSDPTSQLQTADSISLAMERLWTRFLPEITQRITVIESAIDAIESNHGADNLRGQAQIAAHKLAGSLGTFGLRQGTEIARLIEQVFAPGEDPTNITTLRELTKQMRSIIESRPRNV